jgi:hypothetical protein
MYDLIDDLEEYGPGWKWIKDTNPYVNPENCGLDLLTVISEPNMSYQFNLVIIVKDKNSGEIYMAHDSGCSCPTPFERISGLHDMTKISAIADFDRFFEGEGYRLGRMRYYDIRRAREIVLDNL